MRCNWVLGRVVCVLGLLAGNAWAVVSAATAAVAAAAVAAATAVDAVATKRTTAVHENQKGAGSNSQRPCCFCVRCLEVSNSPKCLDLRLIKTRGGYGV